MQACRQLTRRSIYVQINTLSMIRRGDLTEREQRFVTAYIKEPNGTKAAVSAGYSPRTATEQASRLLTRPNVKAEIEKWRTRVATHTEIDAAFVLNKAVEVYERCMQQVEPVINAKGEQITDADNRPLFTFNASAACRALELIGKHVTVQAFKKDAPNQVSGSQNVDFINQFIFNTVRAGAEKKAALGKPIPSWQSQQSPPPRLGPPGVR